MSLRYNIMSTIYYHLHKILPFKSIYVSHKKSVLYLVVHVNWVGRHYHSTIQRESNKIFFLNQVLNFEHIHSTHTYAHTQRQALCMSRFSTATFRSTTLTWFVPRQNPCCYFVPWFLYFCSVFRLDLFLSGSLVPFFVPWFLYFCSSFRFDLFLHASLVPFLFHVSYIFVSRSHGLFCELIICSLRLICSTV
jgi:hypothetical protein